MPSHPITISKTSADHVNRGSVEISGADLTISQSGTTPTFTNMGSIAIAAGRTVTVTGGVCENASAGTIRGAGTLVVSPSALVNAGILAPGASPATISITGAITSAPTSVLAFEIGGYTPGTEFDRIAVSGPVSLAGALDATLLGGFFPTLGDSFVVLTSSALSGGFSCLRGTEIGGGLAIEPRVRSTALVLAVVASTSTNTPPSASDDVANVTYDASVVVPVVANDMDADGDSIFVRSLDLTETMGTAVIDPDAQSITFTPLAFFVGPDTLRYLAGDCSGGSDEGVVIVNVGSPTGVEPPHEDEPTPAALPDAVDFTARLRSNGSAAIVLALPRDADVEIELFDAQGRRVSEILTSRMPAGRHELSWSDPRRASGVYFARLLARTDAGVVRRTARVLLVR
jgi:hypothetical protein